MKPKNRIMCPDCGRPKMLFESESKANNFIKFNKDDMENGNKLRSYYCPACCGWHISHQPYKKTMDTKTDKLINAYRIQTSRNGIFDFLLVEELYKILKRFGFKNRKEVNSLLSQPEYKNKYSIFVQQEAKVKYYTENNL